MTEQKLNAINHLVTTVYVHKFDDASLITVVPLLISSSASWFGNWRHGSKNP